MTDEQLAHGVNWYGIEWARQYDQLRCIVCDKILDDTNGMYSWLITHGHPIAAVTVVFGCGSATHSQDDYDRAATREFGWTLTLGQAPAP